MEKYVQPIIKVCESVFRDFCRTEVKAGEVFFLTRDNKESDWDISGIIGLSGHISGAVSISMKENVAFQVTKILTGIEHNSLDADVIDVIGELINIISGNIKKAFQESFRTTITLPSIVQGKGHRIIWPSEKIMIICIPFTIFSNHEVFLSVAVDQS